MKARALLLFDIDGTLLLSGGAGLRAFNRTFEEHYGIQDAFVGIPVAGRTDPWLLRDAAARVGQTLDAMQQERFRTRYCELLEHEIQHPGPRKGLMPGVDVLIRHLHDDPDRSLALLTGNFARAARIKLEHFGLWQFFPFGAFGDDAPERDALVPVALERAAQALVDFPSAAEVVVIGDTPLDIQCAKAGGARSIAVATGSHDVSTLEAHGADAVLSDLTDIPRFCRTVDRILRV